MGGEDSEQENENKIDQVSTGDFYFFYFFITGTGLGKQLSFFVVFLVLGKMFTFFFPPFTGLTNLWSSQSLYPLVFDTCVNVP